jgi:hypothetical protein
MGIIMAIGIIVAITVIDHTGGRGMNSPIAIQFAEARNVRFVVSEFGVPATIGVVSIAAKQAVAVPQQECFISIPLPHLHRHPAEASTEDPSMT